MRCKLVLCPIDNFTNPGDLLQDFVSGRGPDEGAAASL